MSCVKQLFKSGDLDCMPCFWALICWFSIIGGMMSAGTTPLLARSGASAVVFHTSHRCLACHNRLTTASGEDVSIGSQWRASMMANSARDPYWQASVRREVTDHPRASADIQDECAVCHMPMARYFANQMGRKAAVFERIAFRPGNWEDQLAVDGVSCSLCHQISSQRLGSRESFVGRFLIERPDEAGQTVAYGPFDVEHGMQTIMRSSTGGFVPTKASHIQSSELCATCHTLITHTLDATGKPIGEFPEQVPYQEWLHSDYRDSASCQSCHMPQVEGPIRISSVLGQQRDHLSQHSFVGGNFFMQMILNHFRDELAVEATPAELDRAVRLTKEFLARQTARLQVASLERSSKELVLRLRIENLAGHKLPTAYPSRRVWLQVTVWDTAGRKVFESGALREDGSIAGNDNDEDPERFEPHYEEISRADQVAIYESILGTVDGKVTTGLLFAHHYLKDNRLLPKGFDKQTASPEFAVVGRALPDEDFQGGGDTITYRIAVDPSRGPFRIEARLWYQPISFRWAHNLAPYQAMEPQRFLKYYKQLAKYSATVLAELVTETK